VDDTTLERLLELKLELAQARQKVAELEVTALQYQRCAWITQALLNKAREYAMRSQYHMSNDEPAKAKEQMGNLLGLLKTEEVYPNVKPHE
jgi:hypothetical protein